MNPISVRSRRALRDLDEIAAYLQLQASPRTAIRFLREADVTFARLAKYPSLGAVFYADALRLGEVRYFPISRFRNYVAFYRPHHGGIEVIRVLHGARDLDAALGSDEGQAPEANDE